MCSSDLAWCAASYGRRLYEVNGNVVRVHKMTPERVAEACEESLTWPAWKRGYLLTCSRQTVHLRRAAA